MIKILIENNKKRKNDKEFKIKSNYSFTTIISIHTTKSIMLIIRNCETKTFLNFESYLSWSSFLSSLIEITFPSLSNALVRAIIVGRSP